MKILNEKTLAKKYRSLINSAKDLDQKTYLARLAREEAVMSFGGLVSMLEFSDNSKLKINTKLKASLINS